MMTVSFAVFDSTRYFGESEKPFPQAADIVRPVRAVRR